MIVKASTLVLGAATVAFGASIPSKRLETATFAPNVHPISFEEALAELNGKYPVNSTIEALSGEDSPVNAAAVGTCTKNERKEWRTLSNQEQQNFLSAVQCLMDKPKTGNFQYSDSLYDDLVQAHQSQNWDIHQSELFLPWHRYYLHTFSILLRSECQYKGSLPYWDETQDSGNFHNSVIFSPDTFGSLPPIAGFHEWECIKDGKFGGRETYQGTDKVCLSRGYNETNSAQTGQRYIDLINPIPKYASDYSLDPPSYGYEFYNEGGPHAYGHTGIGGIMSDSGASPGDPIFFLHHGFVDRLWKIWQNKDPKRSTQIGGWADPQQRTRLTLDTVLTTRGLRPDVTVRDVIDTQGEFLCYKYGSP